MKTMLKKMKVRWKFVWLCSLVMLVQFAISNAYLFSHSAELVKAQGEMLVGKYVSQNKGNIENALNSVTSTAYLISTTESFQQYLRKYAVQLFQYDSASVDFQFDCLFLFRNMITQTGYIKEIQIHLEENTFVLSQSSYTNQPNLDLDEFNAITTAPRSTVGWHALEAGGTRQIYYRLPLNANAKTSGIRGWVDLVIHPATVFQSVTDLIPAASSVEVLVLDEQGRPVYTNQPLAASRTNQDADPAPSWPEPGAAVIRKVSGERIMTQSERLSGTDWLLVSSIPRDSFQLDLADYIRTSLFILLIPMVLLVVFILILTDYMLRPLKQLVAVMGSYSESKETPQIITDSLDEFGLLTNRFNKMMRRIKEQITTIRETEQEKREAEMRAFQSQIKQHFLYNTLALISWTARREHAGETERISKLFARYYRLALGKGEAYISLENEIELIGHYLEIQRSRFVDQLDYEVKVEAPLSHYRIIRNMLQPIVENAVEHGVLPKEQGKVLVLIREEHDYLVIRVMDDGMGADEETVRRINNGQSFEGDTGFSLHSIQRTLYSYYGPDAVFDFQSVLQSGSVTTIKLPIAKLR